MIDLQIKRAVLQTAVERAGLVTGVTDTSPPSPDDNDQVQVGEEEKVTFNSNIPTENDSPPEEFLNKAAAPHNTAPVYAFSCMFYTKLTESCRGGYVTKAVCACIIHVPSLLCLIHFAITFF